MNIKKFTQIMLTLVLAITIVSGVRYVLGANPIYSTWVNPTAAPVGNNVLMNFIDTGIVDQVKNAGL